MRPTVYIETTVPSYYCDDRPELANDIARTREWWDGERSDYECFVSPVVMDELSAGQYPHRQECLRLVDGIALLTTAQEILEIAAVYQQQGLMPKSPVRDALHVAFASYYRVDYLLTWNCRHLANARKIPRLEALNSSMRLHVPLLVTPHMLRLWEREV